jgi:hypothetical protein
MKTKKEHIDFWLAQADDDWSAVETLYKGKTICNHCFLPI